MTRPITIEPFRLPEFIDTIICEAPVSPNHTHVVVTAPSSDLARSRFNDFLEEASRLGIECKIRRAPGREKLTFGNYVSVHFVNRRSRTYARGISLAYAVIDTNMTIGQLEELRPAFATLGRSRFIRITDGGALWD